MACCVHRTGQSSSQHGILYSIHFKAMQQLLTASQQVTTASQQVMTASQQVMTASQQVMTASQQVMNASQQVMTASQQRCICAHQQLTTWYSLHHLDTSCIAWLCYSTGKHSHDVSVPVAANRTVFLAKIGVCSFSASPRQETMPEGLEFVSVPGIGDRMRCGEQHGSSPSALL